MKKSKSVLDEVAEAVMIRSPCGSNFNAGKGKLSIWAVARAVTASKTSKAKILIVKVLLPKSTGSPWPLYAPDERTGVGQLHPLQNPQPFKAENPLAQAYS